MNLRSIAGVLLGSLIAVAAYLPQPAHSASLGVSPLRVEMTEADRSQDMQLVNGDSNPLYLQVRVFKWTQENGEDKLVPAKDVVASPAMIKLAGQATQTVRIVRVAAGEPIKTEQAYRVVIDELPVEDLDGQKKKSGLSFRLQYLVPMFISPQQDAAPKLTVSVAGPRSTSLMFSNSGAASAKLEGMDPQGPFANGLVGYALANSSRVIPLPDGKTLSPGQTIKIGVNGNEQVLTIQQRGTH